jgi:flagellar biosynthesis/type III secretory pathway protein FliH
MTLLTNTGGYSGGGYSGSSNRWNRDNVNVGNPVHIQGDLAFRQEFESTLEAVRERRLQDIEQELQAYRQQVKQQIEEMLESAKTDVTCLLENAHQQKEAVHQDAYVSGEKQGFETGYQAGLDKAVQETRALLTSSQLVLEGAHKAETALLRHIRTDIATLITTICNKILKTTLHTLPDEVTLELIEQATESLYLTGMVRVVLHPVHLQRIRQAIGNDAELLAHMKRFEWVTDAQLNEEDIFIVAREGQFDLTPERQVERLVAAITKTMALPSFEEIQELNISSQ